MPFSFVVMPNAFAAAVDLVRASLAIVDEFPSPTTCSLEFFHRFMETVKVSIFSFLWVFFTRTVSHLVRKRYHAVCPAIAFGFLFQLDYRRSWRSASTEGLVERLTVELDLKFLNYRNDNMRKFAMSRHRQSSQL